MKFKVMFNFLPEALSRRAQWDTTLKVEFREGQTKINVTWEDTCLEPTPTEIPLASVSTICNKITMEWT